MLGRFGRDVGSLLGVDIASGSVRMLHLRRQRGHFRVAGWACLPLPTAGSGGDDGAALMQALATAHRRCATRQRKVALALPASQVICKVCKLPRGTCDQDLEAQLLAEAEQLFPFPLDDLAVDFQVLRASVDEAGTVDVMVAACRQSHLDPLEQLFAQVGLEVAAVEVDSFALRRAMGQAQSANTAMIQLETDQIALHRWQHDRVPQRRHLPLATPDRWCEGAASLLQLEQTDVDTVLLVGGAADAQRAAHLGERVGKPCQVLVLNSRDALRGPDASMALAYGLALGGMQ